MANSQANPSWARDEIILALDVYFRFPPPHSGTEANNAIEDLSSLLRQLPIHPQRANEAKFRNINGVRTKMANLQYHDPNYPGGLANGSTLDGIVFREFANARAKLHVLAQAIRSNISEFSAITEEEDGESEALEGKILLRLHRRRERNKGLVRQKKNLALKNEGRLTCAVCDFDYSLYYGALGSGFIECHHTKPISQITPGEKTRLSDLSLVCANCHRMLHRNGLISIVELRKIVIEKRTV